MALTSEAVSPTASAPLEHNDPEKLAHFLAQLSEIDCVSGVNTVEKVRRVAEAIGQYLGFSSVGFYSEDPNWSVLVDVPEGQGLRDTELASLDSGEPLTLVPATDTHPALTICPVSNGDGAVGHLVFFGDGSRPIGLLERELVRLSSGKIGQEIALGLAIRKLEGSQRLLEIESATDFQTGLINQRAFLRYLDKQCERARRYQRSFSLMRLTVDRFSALCDAHGKEVADRLVAACAQRLNAALRRSDVVSRVGQASFAVVLPESDERSALMAAGKMLEVIQASPFVADGQKIPVSVSIGVAGCQFNDDDSASLMSRADWSLHQARKAGGNQCGTPISYDD